MNSLEELFNSIENSKLYQDYKRMESILEKDALIKEQIEEIKELEKAAAALEELGDEKYKDIDELIKEKSKVLESNPVYKEYLSKMDELNDELAISSKMINDYLEENV